MKEKKSLASTITFGALPSASAISGSDIFPGTQSGSDVKYTFQNVNFFLQAANNLNDVQSITTSATNLGLSQGYHVFADNINHTISNPLPEIIGIGNSITCTFTFPNKTLLNINTFGRLYFINNYGSAPQNFVDYLGNPLFTVQAGSNYLYTPPDQLSVNWYSFPVVSTLQSAYNYSSSPQITGSFTFSDGLGDTFSFLGSNSNALWQANTTTKGILPPILTSIQESTLIGSLGSSDAGLFWYNSTVSVPTYWDGLDHQQVLAIDNIIQGTNMNIVNNGDGTVTFSSSGSSGTTTQVQGSFSCSAAFSLTNVTTTPSPINEGGASLSIINSIGTNVATASVGGVTTAIIQNTSVGGRWGIARYDLTMNFQTSGTSVIGFTVYSSAGATLFYKESSVTFTPGFEKEFSFSSPLVYLNTNDYMYLAVNCNSGSLSFYSFRFQGSWIDTTVASLPSTDALSQGSNNLYLSQNGGSTYQNVTTPVTIGNLPSFSTVGGKLQDSGTSISSIISNQLSYSVVTGTTQQITINTVYFVKGTSTVTFTLPPTNSIAGRIEIIGTGTANWIIVPFSGGQFMEFNGLTASTSVQSGTANDNLRILYPGDASGVFNLEFSNGMQIILT